jgi:TolB protein
MNADGLGQTRLTDLPRRNIQPTWSPDGRKVAFTSYRPGSDGTTDGGV